jgi:Tfp pilus assembly PilM family ATPase
MRNQTNKESIVRILDLESDVDKYALQKFITSSISEDGSIIQERVDIEFPFTFLEVYYESLMYSRTCK